MLTALLLLGRKWFGLLLHAPVAAFHARLFFRNEWRVDVTEIFQQSHREKLRRLIKLAVYFVGFLLVVFRYDSYHHANTTTHRNVHRMVETAVWTLLTPEGRATAQKLMHEAIATMHI